ncbi:hypothetical protein ACIREO_05635 [Streptomyces sp. NPDC102441]|uniref:hypothetical protein n=1 Tax=Streptomyces sp. NPDC102441 TaxID=3366176 RepID=UPI0038094D23
MAEGLSNQTVAQRLTDTEETSARRARVAVPARRASSPSPLNPCTNWSPVESSYVQKVNATSTLTGSVTVPDSRPQGS